MLSLWHKMRVWESVFTIPTTLQLANAAGNVPRKSTLLNRGCLSCPGQLEWYNHRRAWRGTSLSPRESGRAKGTGQQSLRSPAWTGQCLSTYRTDQLCHGYWGCSPVANPGLADARIMYSDIYCSLVFINTNRIRKQRKPFSLISFHCSAW